LRRRQRLAGELLMVARAGDDGTAPVDDGERPLRIETLPRKNLPKMTRARA
jgi:hypothetical protein